MTLVELGGVVLGLALLARLSARLDLPTAPLYLLAGLAFGEGGLLPLVTTVEFADTGADLGLIVLLFTFGLEHSSKELLATARTSAPAGVLDFVANAIPGAVTGLLLGWGPLAAAFLAGITYVTSSGAASILVRHYRAAPSIGRVVITISILEDLVMAIYLPILAALLIGNGADVSLLAVGIAVAAVAVLLAVALRVEMGLSQMLFSRSDEALLLSILGFAILVAGIAEVARFSAAVGALLAGILLSGPAARSAQYLLRPLRDLFAALFFTFIGLSTDPSTIPPVLWVAVLLGVVTSVTQWLSGWWAAKSLGAKPGERSLVGAALIPRAEFSLAIAGIATAAAIEDDIAPLTVAFVIVTVVIGSVATRILNRRAARWTGSDPAAIYG